MTETPREIPIHQSPNRPNQLMGADREMVIVSLMIAVCLAFSLATFSGAFCALLFWVAAVWVLRRMGKSDPLMRPIYMRHVRYRPFYAAKSGLYSRVLPVRAGWR